MGLIGFIVAATFWPGQAGAAETSRWASLCVLVSIGLFFVSIRPTVVHVIGVIFLVYAVLSLWWAPVWYDGIAALMQFAIIAGAFLLGHEMEDSTPLYAGIGLGLAISSVVSLLQWYGFEPVVSISSGTSPAGLFINPNFAGEIAALVLIGLVLSEAWWISAGLLPVLLLSHSRAALLSLAVCGSLYIWQRWRWRILIIAPFLIALVFFGTENKWLYSDSMTNRWAIWFDSIDGLNLVGNGIGSFYSTLPEYATRLNTQLYQPWHAHNDLLETAFELGIPGVLLLLALFALIFAGAHQRERSVLLGFCIIAMFGFPLHTPTSAFLIGAVAGHAARAWNVLRWGELCRRPGLHTWRQSAHLERA